MLERPSRFEEVYSWVRRRPFEGDLLLAGTLIVLLVAPLMLYHRNPAGAVISLALLACLALRRSQPIVTGLLVASIGMLQLTSRGSVLPADVVAAVIALYSLAAYAPNWAGLCGLLVGFVGTLVAAFEHYPLPRSYQPLLFGFIAFLAITVWSLGRLRRLGRREELRLTERAKLLERERDQESRLAATDERARIAREMHDVVAHSLSVTISQADGGRYAARTDPQAAITALETIATTGRQALADMRVLLGVLRQDEGSELAPQPDPDSIPELVEQMRVSGLQVGLEVLGQPRQLAGGPGLAAYRIVQESLTNVLKHAGPNSRAWVRLSWLAGELEVSVQDDGRGAAGGLGEEAKGSGMGVRGMRERAALHGGTLQAGPRRGGGFAVLAVLPYRSPR